MMSEVNNHEKYEEDFLNDFLKNFKFALSLFDLNLKIENNKVFVFDNEGNLYDIYNQTAGVVVPSAETPRYGLTPPQYDCASPRYAPFVKDYPKIEFLYELHGNIGNQSHTCIIQPKGTPFLGADFDYTITIDYSNNWQESIINLEHIYASKTVHLSPNKNARDDQCIEFQYNNNNYHNDYDGITGSLRYVHNITPITEYIVYDGQGMLKYESHAYKDNKPELFTIGDLNNIPLITSVYSEVNDKETVITVFEQDPLFQKILSEYFPKIKEKYELLKSEKLESAILQNPSDIKNGRNS